MDSTSLQTLSVKISCQSDSIWFKRGKKVFQRRYVTIDETWIHHYTPETKGSSAEWTGVGQSCPKRPKTEKWAGKVMASVFYDAMVFFVSTILRKVKPLKMTITWNYWIDSAQKSRKNGLTCKRKKCCFTRTMHRATSP